MSMSIKGMDGLTKIFKPIDDSKKVIVIAKADHGVHVEYGTSRMPAQAYARPGTERALGRFNVETFDTLPKAVLGLAEEIAKEWRELAPVDTGELRESIEVIHGK